MSRWPPQLNRLIKHKNGYNSVIFTANELNFGVIVADSDSQLFLQAELILTSNIGNNSSSVNHVHLLAKSHEPRNGFL